MPCLEINRSEEHRLWIESSSDFYFICSEFMVSGVDDDDGQVTFANAAAPFTTDPNVHRS